MIEPAVLVVDEDFAQREALAFLLRRMGFSHIEKHEELASAWMSVLSSPPVMIIARCAPGSSLALALLRRLRGTRQVRDVPFLVVSDHLPEKQWVEFIAAGASDFFTERLRLTAFSKAVTGLLLTELGHANLRLKNW